VRISLFFETSRRVRDKSELLVKVIECFAVCISILIFEHVCKRTAFSLFTFPMMMIMMFVIVIVMVMVMFMGMSMIMVVIMCMIGMLVSMNCIFVCNRFLVNVCFVLMTMIVIMVMVMMMVVTVVMVI
jgi:hypothetical protein